MKPADQQKMQDVVDAYVLAGSQAKAGELLGLSKKNIWKWLAIARTHKIKPSVKAYPDVKEREVAVTPVEEVNRSERMRYEDKLQRMRNELNEAHRELYRGDDLRESLFRLASERINPPDWTLELSDGHESSGDPILFTSDFQWGEVISARELDGYNEFNNAIAKARYRKLIERTIDICFNHTVNPTYKGLWYLRGGDMISGDIHQELRETNDLQSIPAVVDLVEQEAWGIKTLADRFGKVHVISVPGNHGRCLQEDTEILTLSGWKRAAEIAHDDYVATVDIKNGITEYHLPEQITKFTERGAWRISGHYRSELVTREHKIPYHGILTPIEQLPDEFNAAAVDVACRTNGDDDAAYARLMTWVVMDGTVVDRSRHDDGYGYRLQWRLKRERKIVALSSLLSNMGVPFTQVNEKDGVTKITVFGEWARRIAEDTGSGLDKQIPARYSSASAITLEAILDTICATDGSQRTKHGLVEWSATCKHNMDVIQAACAANGIPFRVSLNEHPTGYANRAPLFTAHFQRFGMTSRSGSHKVQREWVDEAFNFVGVQMRYGTLITRRDGKSCVTGNTTIKPYAKRYSETNFDTLSAWMLEREFRDDPRVTFQTSLSTDALFNVNGYDFLLSHGDKIGSSGGKGFIGPIATIARGHQQLIKDYATKGKLLDYVLTGHFHTSVETEWGFGNGCLPGYSEYARDLRAKPAPPTQWLFHCHPSFGITQRWKIYTNER